MRNEAKLKRRTAYSGTTRKAPRHAFLFQIGDVVKPIYVKVRPAKSSVELTLTAEHVRHAIKANGFGNAQQCAGAMCVKSHGNVFSHSFSGYVDWLYRRVYISSKNDALTNLPSICVAYSHQDNIAKLFDTKAGLKQLLTSLEKDGPRTITLHPPSYLIRELGRPRGKNTGERIMKKKGHHARVERVKLGGLLAA